LHDREHYPHTRRVILLIDNHDSFTWNLVHLFCAADRRLRPGRSLLVFRNDAITPDQAASLRRGRGPTHIVISPGPCTPDQAGCSPSIIRLFAGRVPILGVCLGHQSIAAAFNMPVTRAPVPVHGKTSLIEHDARGIFTGLPKRFTAMRYHSLAVPSEAIDPERWSVSARTPDGVVMGLRREWTLAPLEGVQFHPESYRTQHGVVMARNFLRA
jgi:anthranilate synthase/aminodeoxychorismate synthase-like glutamine amidotransferase